MRQSKDAIWQAKSHYGVYQSHIRTGEREASRPLELYYAAMAKLTPEERAEVERNHE